MKHIFLILSLIFPLALTAAPKWSKTAMKSMVTLYAIQQSGDTLQANAFFVDTQGKLVAPFKVIEKAQRAWVYATGKQYEVSRIAGFNSTYNVTVLQTQGMKKSVALPPCTAAATKGETLYLTPQATPDEVTQVEKAGEYCYYTLVSKSNAQWAGTPVVNEAGEVTGILQTPIVTEQSPNYVLDIRYAMELNVRPIDANHPDLRQCNIPKQMPDNEEQATSFLYIAQNVSDNEMWAYIEEFITRFPKSPTGYIQKAEYLMAHNQQEAANATTEEGLKAASDKADEILYARARYLYNTYIASKQQAAKTDDHNMEKALEDIGRAVALNPQPLYILQQANILYALKKYEEAYQKYISLTQTSMRSPEYFLYAWQCQQNLGASSETLLALNDSAIALFTKPYPTSVAPYLYLRSNTLRDLGRLREAINDLNDYEHLVQGERQLNAEFYYQREQMEVGTRMYAPALNDIQRAITLAPQEPLYHAELAVLFFRLNNLDDAITECKRALALDEKYPDAYRIWGICLREQGNIAAAKEKLEKAVEYGDTLAKDILGKL